ncbi:MAG: hypothetical protein QXH26_01910 [Candidatus Hadarchaeales archaeon]
MEGIGIGSGWELKIYSPAPYLLLFGGLLGLGTVLGIMWKEMRKRSFPREESLPLPLPTLLLGGLLAFLGWIWATVTLWRKYLQLGIGVGYGFGAGFLGPAMMLTSFLALRKGPSLD